MTSPGSDSRRGYGGGRGCGKVCTFGNRADRPFVGRVILGVEQLYWKLVTEVAATNSHNNRSCQLFGSDRTLQLNIFDERCRYKT